MRRIKFLNTEPFFLTIRKKFCKFFPGLRVAIIVGVIGFTELVEGSVPQRGVRSEVIYLDAGHGGKDRGTSSKDPYCEEKNLTLSMVLATQNYLRRIGYRPILTRGSDVYVDLHRRANLANAGKADVFVSIHCNYSSNTAAFGTEVYYYNGKGCSPERAKQSEDLGKKILYSMEKSGSLKSRSVKVGNFAVIRETTMPAVLIEVGFLSNVREKSCLLDGRYRLKISKGIAEGIHQYLSNRGKLVEQKAKVSVGTSQPQSSLVVQQPVSQQKSPPVGKK